LDPDAAFHFNAGPDPDAALLVDADPDYSPHQSDANLLPLIDRASRASFLASEF
jgi:hypothetical protein